MSKLSGGGGIAAVATAIAALTPGAPASAAPIGPHAAACARDDGAAMLVHVVGFKERRGTVRVQSYGGHPSTFFEKGRWLNRIDVAVPAGGAADVCVPVPNPGVYAVSVRHDVDRDGKSGRADGGGMSGNPRLSLADILFKRKPPASAVSVQVGRGVTSVPVVLSYLQGTVFRPLATTAAR